MSFVNHINVPRPYSFFLGSSHPEPLISATTVSRHCCMPQDTLPRLLLLQARSFRCVMILTEFCPSLRRLYQGK